MRVLVFGILISIAFISKAVENNETRIRQLEEKLRCLVCQNQSLADSNAELAGDLRKQVREQIAAGKSDDNEVARLPAARALGLDDNGLVRVMLESQTDLEMLQTALG